MKNVRETTCKLIELAEEGTLPWETIARCALGYMSESEVADMARTEDLIFEDIEEEEDSE